MRIGQNPAKAIEHVAQPHKITVALVNYIPFLSGYFAHSLEVLQASLTSLWEHTNLEYDLLVFDNASCGEVRRFLGQAHEQGKIQYLVLSDKNVGKSGAWNFIFAAAPGEYVAYADNDIYYYPGWLAALMKVMEYVPDVGMVTGMPLLNPEEFSSSTLAWGQRHPEAQLERGRLLPWQDYWRHAGTLGNTEEKARTFYDEHESIVLTYRGEKYYVGAGHFQFLARKAVLQRALPMPSQRPMGQVRALDVAINEMGYLRLCTPAWNVRHLGNTLSGEDVVVSGAGGGAALRSGARVRGVLRRVLSAVHEKTFDLLYR